MFGLGVKIFFSRRAKDTSPDGDINYLHDYSSTFLLTLMNPVTILAFAAALAGLGVVTSNRVNAGLFVGGVFVGSAFWWVTLSVAAGVFHGKLSSDSFGWLGKVSGAVIAAFGVFVFLTWLY